MKSHVKTQIAVGLLLVLGTLEEGGCVIASSSGDATDDGGSVADGGGDGGLSDGGLETEDAGASTDAGATMDAGEMMDASVADSGADIDAGFVDAGDEADGGSESDGGDEDAGEAEESDGGPTNPDAGDEDAGLAPSVLSTLREAGGFEILLGAIEEAGLSDALAAEGPFTLLAPSDVAFESWPEGAFASLSEAEQETILRYHVLPDARDTPTLFADTPLSTLAGLPMSFDVTEAGVIINGLGRVFWPNQIAPNGIVHGVDAVILPPGQAFPGSISSFLDAYPRFLRLMEALRLAALDDTLAGAGPFTLFAPTNEAFLNAGIDVQTLPDAELTRLLLRHVVSGNVLAADLAGTSQLSTVSGDIVPVQFDVVPVLQSDVNIIAADYGCNNGWVHVIDGVLLLPEE